MIVKSQLITIVANIFRLSFWYEAHFFVLFVSKQATKYSHRYTNSTYVQQFYATVSMPYMYVYISRIDEEEKRCCIHILTQSFECPWRKTLTMCARVLVLCRAVRSAVAAAAELNVVYARVTYKVWITPLLKFCVHTIWFVRFNVRIYENSIMLRWIWLKTEKLNEGRKFDFQGVVRY